jgi:3-oxoacyl-[acyl-carrier-protein] synthase-3
MTSRGRGVSILEMEQEQPFWVEKKIWLKGSCLHLHSEGQHAEELILKAPGMGGRWVTDIIADNDPDDVIFHEWPIRFQECSSSFSEVINEALEATCRFQI